MIQVRELERMSFEEEQAVARLQDALLDLEKLMGLDYGEKRCEGRAGDLRIWVEREKPIDMRRDIALLEGENDT